MQKCYNITVIRDIKKQEMPFIDLPEMFSRLFTDDDIDIGRKLDKGNDLLTDIKADTAVLSSFVAEQRVHNQRLEKILERLTER